MSQRIVELREKRAEVVAQAREELDKILPDMSAEQAKEYEARFDAAMEEADKIGARIEREERAEAAASDLEKVEERKAGREDAAAKPTEAPDQRDVFKRMIQFGAGALDVDERTALAEMRANISPEMRAQAAGTDAAGGYTIPEGFLPEITKAMAAWGPMLDPGITRVVDTATGNNLPWPTTDDTSNVGALLAENTQIAEQDVTFAQKNLGAYVFTSKMVRVSYQLLQDSAFSMDSLLTELFGERIGRAANTYLTTGTGTAQPEGIVTGASAGATAASTSAITADELIDHQHSVDPAYRNAPGIRWMFHDSTLKAIRKLKDGDGNYLWQLGDVRVGAPATILGSPYTVNQAMDELSDGASSNVVLYGDMQKYIVRRVREFDVLRLAERYADYLQVGFFAYNRIDGAVVDSAAIKKLALAAA